MARKNLISSRRDEQFFKERRAIFKSPPPSRRSWATNTQTAQERKAKFKSHSALVGRVQSAAQIFTAWREDTCEAEYKKAGQAPLQAALCSETGSATWISWLGESVFGVSPVGRACSKVDTAADVNWSKINFWAHEDLAPLFKAFSESVAARTSALTWRSCCRKQPGHRLESQTAHSALRFRMAWRLHQIRVWSSVRRIRPFFSIGLTEHYVIAQAFTLVTPASTPLRLHLFLRRCAPLSGIIVLVSSSRQQ